MDGETDALDRVIEHSNNPLIEDQVGSDMLYREYLGRLASLHTVVNAHTQR